jgi:predicted nucleic acid-binding protein
VNQEIWVINALPLILLGKMGRTDLLLHLARQVIVPRAVFSEVAAGSAGDAAMEAALEWAIPRVQDDILVPASISGWDLGAGESQVLAQCVAGAIEPCWMTARHVPRRGFIPSRWSAVWALSCVPARQG